MDFEKLTALTAMVEEGTQERAAERLFCTQSALSKQLAALESELGRPLFFRRGKGLILNRDGETAYRFAVRVLAEREALLEQWRKEEQDPPAIRLGVTGSVGIYQLPAILRRAGEELPRVPVRFVIGTCPRLISMLDCGELGLILLPQGTPFGGGDSRQSWTLFSGGMPVVVPPGHPLAGRRDASFGELCRFPFLLPGGDSATRHFALGLFREKEMTPPKILDFGSVEAIKEGIRQGLGLSILPEAAVARELAAGELCRCDLRGGPLRRKVDCVLSRGRRITPQEQRFLSFFSNEASPAGCR